MSNIIRTAALAVLLGLSLTSCVTGIVKQTTGVDVYSAFVPNRPDPAAQEKALQKALEEQQRLQEQNQ